MAVQGKEQEKDGNAEGAILTPSQSCLSLLEKRPAGAERALRNLSGNQGGDTMAEFTPIMTQAEFDAAIAERLSRQERSIAQRYEGAVPKADADAMKAGLEKQIEDLTKQIKVANSAKAASEEQLTQALAKIKGYETDSVKTRIALEVGLPYGMAGRLNGETEEDIRKDAEALKGFMKPAAAPLANPEPAPGDPQKAALLELARNLGQT